MYPTLKKALPGLKNLAGKKVGHGVNRRLLVECALENTKSFCVKMDRAVEVAAT